MCELVVIWRRFGPYHVARLTAAAERLHLVGLELSGADTLYAWERIDEPLSFPRVTLFTGQDSRTLSGPVVAREVRFALNDIRPRVVVIPGWSDRGALGALEWCRRTGTPVVVMSESQRIDVTRWRWKEAVKRRIVSMCSAGLVGGTPHAEYLVSLGMPRRQVFVGCDVVDNTHFAAGAGRARKEAESTRSRLGLPVDYFLASSRFIGKKNLLRLLRAYALYRGSAGAAAWKLVLLGDGRLGCALLELRSRLGLDESVFLPGFKQYDELPAYYGLARAFVHASTVEQWGLVVNEAMASGLPVLVSERCGCVVDLVREGVNGFTFDPYDVDALAGHMLKIAGGERDLESMGRTSREIISRWSPETFATGLERAVEAAMHLPGRETSAFDQMLLWLLIRR